MKERLQAVVESLNAIAGTLAEQQQALADVAAELEAIAQDIED